MRVLSRQRAVSLIAIQVGPSNASGGVANRAVAKRQARGFTLVELMITLVIAIVLITIAVPSFQSIILSNKLTTTANDLVASINIARMEAIKSNAYTQLCGSTTTANSTDTLGAACNTPSGQAGAVYVLINGVAKQVSGNTGGLPTSLQLSSAGMAGVRFDGQGLGYTPGTTTLYDGTVADICTSSISSDNQRIVTLTAGSIIASASSSATTAGTCP